MNEIKTKENIEELKGSSIDWSQEAANLLCCVDKKDRENIRNTVEQIYLDQEKVRIEKEDFFKTLPELTKLYKNCIKLNYEKNFASIDKIEQVPFEKEVFLVSSADGSSRFYSGLFLTSQ